MIHDISIAIVMIAFPALLVACLRRGEGKYSFRVIPFSILFFMVGVYAYSVISGQGLIETKTTPFQNTFLSGPTSKLAAVDNSFLEPVSPFFRHTE
jgi:hypothetical protein